MSNFSQFFMLGEARDGHFNVTMGRDAAAALPIPVAVGSQDPSRPVCGTPQHPQKRKARAEEGDRPPRRPASSRRSRSAEFHNMSERKRRDKINEKMKQLQELLPHCNKTDKASMLDEAIEYLKSLQLQLQSIVLGNGVAPMVSAEHLPYLSMPAAASADHQQFLPYLQASCFEPMPAATDHAAATGSFSNQMHFLDIPGSSAHFLSLHNAESNPADQATGLGGSSSSSGWNTEKYSFQNYLR